LPSTAEPTVKKPAKPLGIYPSEIGKYCTCRESGAEVLLGEDYGSRQGANVYRSKAGVLSRLLARLGVRRFRMEFRDLVVSKRGHPYVVRVYEKSREELSKYMPVFEQLISGVFLCNHEEVVPDIATAVAVLGDAVTASVFRGAYYVSRGDEKGKMNFSVIARVNTGTAIQILVGMGTAEIRIGDIADLENNAAEALKLLPVFKVDSVPPEKWDKERKQYIIDIPTDEGLYRGVVTGVATEDDYAAVRAAEDEAKRLELFKKYSLAIYNAAEELSTVFGDDFAIETSTPSLEYEAGGPALRYDITVRPLAKELAGEKPIDLSLYITVRYDNVFRRLMIGFAARSRHMSGTDALLRGVAQKYETGAEGALYYVPPELIGSFVKTFGLAVSEYFGARSAPGNPS